MIQIKSKKTAMIGSVLAGILLLIIIFLLGMQLIRQAAEIETYEVISSSAEMYQGKSVVADQQLIFHESNLVTEQVHVESHQQVDVGAQLITYRNPVVTEQITTVTTQLANIRAQITTLETKEIAVTTEISQIEKNIALKQSQLADPLVDAQQSMILQQEIAQLQSELLNLQTTLQTYVTTLDTLNETEGEQTREIEQLQKTERKIVTATVAGIVAIDKTGLIDQTKPYLRVSSQEPLIQAVATEFNIEKLRVGQVVRVRI
ncbi:MAG: hypothetical protein ACRC6H_06850, partial [Culicoidibacterales bacterium]